MSSSANTYEIFFAEVALLICAGSSAFFGKINVNNDAIKVLRMIQHMWTISFHPPLFFLQVVDFSLGIYEQYAQLFMQLPKQSASWTTYVDVFHSSFWYALLASVVVSAAFFHLVFRWSNFRQKVRERNISAHCMHQPETLLCHQENFNCMLFVQKILTLLI